MKIKKLVHLFQPQAPSSYDGIVNYWLPYSAACLWAYATQYPELMAEFDLAKLHYRREPLDQVLELVYEEPALCGFSCYVWNEQYCLLLAERIKQKWPNCNIIFGGPQVSAKYLAYDFVDAMVMAEGEESFSQILHDKISNRPLKRIYEKKRLHDLDIPSPVLLGLFDPIVAELKSNNQRFDAVLETNRGCPYACTFCDWGGTTYSKVKKFGIQRVYDEIDWFKETGICNCLYLADANFGIFKDRDADIARKLAEKNPECKIEWVFMTWLKNSNEQALQIASLLGDLFRGMTLSVQSMNPKTLKAIKRDNMATNDMARALAMSEKYRVPTYTELILGLPEETLESWKNGIAELLRLGQHKRMDIYFAQLLENSEMNLTQKILYGIKSIEVDNYTKPLDIDGIAERSEIVIATNTMSREDIIEAYMYSWLIIRCHNWGYTQLLAKFSYYVHGVDYREFYESLEKNLLSRPGKILDAYMHLKSSITEMLTTGKQTHGMVGSYDYKTFGIDIVHTNFLEVIDLITEIFKIDQGIVELQKRYIYSDFYPEQNDITLDWNIETWTREPITYRVTPCITDENLDRDDLYSAFRQDKLRNKIHVVEKSTHSTKCFDASAEVHSV